MATVLDEYRRREYLAWVAMRQRCRNTRLKAYSNYGGRGIGISKEWDSFEQFWADMGPRPSAENSLDRIDVNGNYEARNCRWATRKEQGANKRPRSEWRADRRGSTGSQRLYLTNKSIISMLSFGS